MAKTNLHLFLKHNNTVVEISKKITQENINKHDDSGKTPLLIALEKKRPLEIIQELLNNGADPKIGSISIIDAQGKLKKDCENYTSLPLLECVYKEIDIKIIEALLEKNNELNPGFSIIDQEDVNGNSANQHINIMLERKNNAAKNFYLKNKNYWNSLNLLFAKETKQNSRSHSGNIDQTSSASKISEKGNNLAAKIITILLLAAVLALNIFNIIGPISAIIIGTSILVISYLSMYVGSKDNNTKAITQQNRRNNGSVNSNEFAHGTELHTLISAHEQQQVISNNIERQNG